MKKERIQSYQISFAIFKVYRTWQDGNCSRTRRASQTHLVWCPLTSTRNSSRNTHRLIPLQSKLAWKCTSDRQTFYQLQRRGLSRCKVGRKISENEVTSLRKLACCEDNGPSKEIVEFRSIVLFFDTSMSWVKNLKNRKFIRAPNRLSIFVTTW